MNLTDTEIVKALELAGVTNQQYLFLHSSLFMLGKLQSCDLQATPRKFLDLLKEVSGTQSNLFVPTFNYNFPSSRNENLIEQVSEMGVFSEFVRQHQDSVRSGHPMFSISGIGQEAETICRPNEPEFHPFNEHSTFARLLENDALLMLQGVNFGVATVVVLIEYLLKVKYRFDKPFFGDVTLHSGKKVSGEFFHFCFPLNGEYRENYQPFVDFLMREDLITSVKLGRGKLTCISFKQLYNAITKLIEQDPFILLNKYPQHLYTFQNGKEVAHPL